LRRLQPRRGLGADHAPVGHDAEASDRKALTDRLHHRQQTLDVGRVARPHLTADRQPRVIDDHPEHQLLRIRPVVLAEAALATVEDQSKALRHENRNRSSRSRPGHSCMEKLADRASAGPMGFTTPFTRHTAAGTRKIDIDVGGLGRFIDGSSFRKMQKSR
jgi:hypothetical protein